MSTRKVLFSVCGILFLAYVVGLGFSIFMPQAIAKFPGSFLIWMFVFIGVMIFATRAKPPKRLVGSAIMVIVGIVDLILALFGVIVEKPAAFLLGAGIWLANFISAE